MKNLSFFFFFLIKELIKKFYSYKKVINEQANLNYFHN